MTRTFPDVRHGLADSVCRPNLDPISRCIVRLAEEFCLKQHDAPMTHRVTRPMKSSSHVGTFCVDLAFIPR
jgi:hypothetical protein